MITTTDKDPEPESTVDKELKDAEVVITTPFSQPTPRETGLPKHMAAKPDAVAIECSLHKCPKGSFAKELISHMKDGAYLVNTARGNICVAEDVVEVIKSEKLVFYDSYV